MIASLRRCWSFSQANFQVIATYRVNFAMMTMAGLIAVVIQASLWQAVFVGSSSSTLAGFTLGEMIAYVLVARLISLLLNSRVEHEVAADIMRGDISAAIVRPVDYQAQKFFLGLPVMLSNVLFVGGPIVALSLLPLEMARPSAADFLPFLVSVCLSVGIAFAIDFMVGCAAFWTTNIWGLQMCRSAISGFFSGQVIPLSFFSGFLADLAYALPFRALVYTPLCILLGKYASGAELAWLLGQQLAWLLALLSLSRITWRAASARLEVLGG